MPTHIYKIKKLGNNPFIKRSVYYKLHLHITRLLHARTFSFQIGDNVCSSLKVLSLVVVLQGRALP